MAMPTARVARVPGTRGALLSRTAQQAATVSPP